MADKQATTQRDGFKSKWGFILACIGSAVGMGNIWRFPIMVSLWGGMTFLIPYFICVILIGCFRGGNCFCSWYVVGRCHRRRPHRRVR